MSIFQYNSQNSSGLTLQASLKNLLNSIRQDLIQRNLVQQNGKNQLKDLLNLSQSKDFEDQCYITALSNTINYLADKIIEQQQNNQYLLELTSNTEENDKKILQALQIFVDFTQKMADFSKDIFKQRFDQQIVPVQIFRHFRRIYQLTDEFSSIFNSYTMNNQVYLDKRNDLISMQIKYMEGIFLEQQSEKIKSVPSKKNKFIDKFNQNKLDQQNQEYVISLRQQISRLHQTLLNNDEEFTIQIQNYNKTLREMENTIKAYEAELSKITSYEIKIEDLQSIIVRMREEKYRNQIVIENMAKKIRIYEKQFNGPRTFLSPQKINLANSPEPRLSPFNLKRSSVISALNSINSNGRKNILIPNTIKAYY